MPKMRIMLKNGAATESPEEQQARWKKEAEALRTSGLVSNLDEKYLFGGSLKADVEEKDVEAVKALPYVGVAAVTNDVPQQMIPTLEEMENGGNYKARR